VTPLRPYVIVRADQVGVVCFASCLNLGLPKPEPH
jgi:hypothetical protein